MFCGWESYEGVGRIYERDMKSISSSNKELIRKLK